MSELRHLFETNVVATLHLSQAVLPGCVRRRYGRIITIGSTGGRFTSPGAGAYHTVKYAVEALSLSLGAEVAPFGVRVVLIDPTGVRTPFVTSQFETEHSYPDDDPYGDFKIRYSETTRRLATTPGADCQRRHGGPRGGAGGQGQKSQTALHRRGFRESLRIRTGAAERPDVGPRDDDGYARLTLP